MIPRRKQDRMVIGWTVTEVVTYVTHAAEVWREMAVHAVWCQQPWERERGQSVTLCGAGGTVRRCVRVRLACIGGLLAEI